MRLMAWSDTSVAAIGCIRICPGTEITAGRLSIALLRIRGISYIPFLREDIEMASSRLNYSSLAAATLVALSLSITGCGTDSAEPSRRGGGGATPVEAMLVTPQPIEDRIYTTGTLMANEEVQLKPEIDGRVTGVNFEEGGRIKKGQVLLTLNDRELLAQLKRKELQESLAADEERRQRALLDINGISQEDYDKVHNSLEMIRAEREVIESQLAETRIVAPFDGVVGLRYVSEGSVITKNTLVATVQDIDPIKVEFSIPEKYAGKLQPGAEVTVRVGDEEKAFSGSVYAVEAKVDPATRTLKARASIPNPKGRLIPGSFAKVDLVLERIENAVVIPTDAVVPELVGAKVFVSRGETAESVPIETGIRTDKMIQITSGLHPDDTLILTGLLQLTEGRPVKITSMQTP